MAYKAFWELAYCLSLFVFKEITEIFFGDIFRKVIMYPEAKEMQRTFKSNGSNYGGVFVPENWIEKFIKLIQYFIIHFYSFM